MQIIKTTKAMRDNYVTHMNKLEDHAQGKFEDDTCYMCTAGRAHPDIDETQPACDFCPIFEERLCNGSMRSLNLRNMLGGQPVSTYESATPKSIRKHIHWLEGQIKKNTDCELYWEKA